MTHIADVARLRDILCAYQKIVLSQLQVKVILMIAILGFASHWASAQTNIHQATDPHMELNGLVIDETVTKVGRDFYELFYARWEAPSSSVSYTLHIKEQPQPGRGTLITLLLNDTPLMNQAIQPREEILIAVADYAVQLAYRQILNEEQMAKQLENEDQHGSGIF